MYLFVHEEEREGHYDAESRLAIHSERDGLKRGSKLSGGFPLLTTVGTLHLSLASPLFPPPRPPLVGGGVGVASVGQRATLGG